MANIKGIEVSGNVYDIEDTTARTDATEAKTTATETQESVETLSDSVDTLSESVETNTTEITSVKSHSLQYPSLSINLSSHTKSGILVNTEYSSFTLKMSSSMASISLSAELLGSFSEGSTVSFLQTESATTARYTELANAFGEDNLKKILNNFDTYVSISKIVDSPDINVLIVGDVQVYVSGNASTKTAAVNIRFSGTIARVYRGSSFNGEQLDFYTTPILSQN